MAEISHGMFLKVNLDIGSSGKLLFFTKWNLQRETISVKDMGITMQNPRTAVKVSMECSHLNTTNSMKMAFISSQLFIQFWNG